MLYQPLNTGRLKRLGTLTLFDLFQGKYDLWGDGDNDTSKTKDSKKSRSRSRSKDRKRRKSNSR
jgi:hypothetical protein